MTIQQIKEEFQLPTTFVVNHFINQQGNQSIWLTYWDKDQRIQVSMVQATIDSIKSNPQRDDLTYEKEILKGATTQMPYTRITISISDINSRDYENLDPYGGDYDLDQSYRDTENWYGSNDEDY